MQLWCFILAIQKHFSDFNYREHLFIYKIPHYNMKRFPVN